MDFSKGFVFETKAMEMEKGEVGSFQSYTGRKSRSKSRPGRQGIGEERDQEGSDLLVTSTGQTFEGRVRNGVDDTVSVRRGSCVRKESGEVVGSRQNKQRYSGTSNGPRGGHENEQEKKNKVSNEYLMEIINKSIKKIKKYTLNTTPTQYGRRRKKHEGRKAFDQETMPIVGGRKEGGGQVKRNVSDGCPEEDGSEVSLLSCGKFKTFGRNVRYDGDNCIDGSSDGGSCGAYGYGVHRDGRCREVYHSSGGYEIGCFSGGCYRGSGYRDSGMSEKKESFCEQNKRTVRRKLIFNNKHGDCYRTGGKVSLVVSATSRNVYFGAEKEEKWKNKKKKERKMKKKSKKSLKGEEEDDEEDYVVDEKKKYRRRVEEEEEEEEEEKEGEEKEGKKEEEEEREKEGEKEEEEEEEEVKEKENNYRKPDEKNDERPSFFAASDQKVFYRRNSSRKNFGDDNVNKRDDYRKKIYINKKKALERRRNEGHNDKNDHGVNTAVAGKNIFHQAEATEASVRRAAEAAVRRSAEAAGRRSAEAAVRKSAEAAVRRSAEAAVRKSAEAAVRRSAEAAVRRSAEAAVRRAAEEAVRSAEGDAVDADADENENEITEFSFYDGADLLFANRAVLYGEAMFQYGTTFYGRKKVSSYASSNNEWSSYGGGVPGEKCGEGEGTEVSDPVKSYNDGAALEKSGGRMESQKRKFSYNETDKLLLRYDENIDDRINGDGYKRGGSYKRRSDIRKHNKEENDKETKNIKESNTKTSNKERMNSRRGKVKKINKEESHEARNCQKDRSGGRFGEKVLTEGDSHRKNSIIRRYYKENSRKKKEKNKKKS